MKKIGTLIIAGIFLNLGCARNFVKKPFTFTTMFVPGDTTFYNIDIQKQINSHEGDSIKSFKMNYSLLVREKVEEVSSDFITLILKIDKASGNVTRNNEPFATDVFKSLKGHTIIMRITSDGSIAYIKGTEKFPTLLGTGAERLSDIEVFSFLYDYINPGEIKPGKIYKKDIKAGRKVFRYEGIDKTRYAGNVALITFKSSFENEDAGYMGTYPYKELVKGSGTGTIYHLLKDGRLLEGTEKFTLKDDYTFIKFPNMNKEVMVYTELRVRRAQETGGKEHE